MSIVNSKEYRTWFTGKVWEPFFWKLKRLSVKDLYRTFSSNQWDSVEVFNQRQRDRLLALLHHAANNVPYYRNFYLKSKFEAWPESSTQTLLQKWPILEKDHLIQHLEELRVEMGRGTLMNSTGGSTGAPVSLYQDNTYQSATLAAIDLVSEWAGCLPGGRKAIIWGAQRDITHGGQGLWFHLGNFLGNRIILNSFSLTRELMRQYFDRINSFSPILLEGYVDSLYEFSRFIQEGRLNLKHPPRSIITSAGTLLPYMRSSIEGAFGCPVFDRYGSREAGAIAAECSAHDGLHILGETTIVEVVDSDANPARPGEEGDILVINLWNYTMPLIRYRIGDRGVLSSKDMCPCRRPYPLLQSVSGRSSGCFFLKDGGVVSPAFFIHFLGVVHNDGAIAEFQVVQKSYEHIVVRLVPRRHLDLRFWPKRTVLVSHIKRIMGEDCRVDFQIDKSIEKSPTGKHLYTVTELERPKNQ